MQLRLVSWRALCKEWRARGLSNSLLAQHVGVNRATAKRWLDGKTKPHGPNESAAYQVFLKFGLASPSATPRDQVQPSGSTTLGVECSREAKASQEEAGIDSFAKEQMRTLIARMTVREADLLWPVLRQMYDACKHATEAPADKEAERRAS